MPKGDPRFEEAIAIAFEISLGGLVHGDPVWNAGQLLVKQHGGRVIRCEYPEASNPEIVF